MRVGSRLGLGLSAMTIVVVTATPASAGFVGIFPHGAGSQLQVTGGPEANRIEVTRNGTTYVVTDTAGTLTAGQGCSGGGTTVTCPDPTDSVVRVVADAADGFDSLVLGASIPGLLNGGPDSDRITGGPLADRLIGGGGQDLLIGGDGDDRLFGGGREDQLVGAAGRDRFFGEQGADRLRAKDGQRDVVSGGPARDRATVDGKDRVKNDVEQVAG